MAAAPGAAAGGGARTGVAEAREPSAAERAFASPRDGATEESFARDQRRCEEFAHRALENSPMIHFLLTKMDARGCRLPADFVKCVPAPEGKVIGGFHAEQRKVFLNSVATKDQKTVTRTILHELVHAFDICRVHFDPTNCRHVACTEIRAANLSDECSFSAEMGRLNFGFGGQQKKCVKRRAILSIEDHEACRDKSAEQVVGSVFRRCYLDTDPFPSHPV